jgi:hypothetical protein
MTYNLQHRLSINDNWLNTGKPWHESKLQQAVDKCHSLGPDYRIVDSNNKQVYPKEGTP